MLIIVGIGLIVAAAAIYINAQIGYKQASDSYAKIEKQYVSDKDGSGIPVVDFDALAQTNPEIVGWIYVPDTTINYPVVQANNNSKYLNTLFDGTSNASGAIFLDCDDTAPGMVDQQTTIYGHHMNDGSMFNIISDTTDQAKFDSIEYVYYITRDGTYKLRPLATKVVEDTYAKARATNFEGDDGLTNYLSEMLDGASAVANDATDRAASATKVVTLVTCRSLSFSNTRAVMVLTPVEE
ncbi:class B sortase [Collinsella sp. HCP28S3_F2]|uniref:class B sortase n=1 Tax=unclassified Collinsella TaxID=2637548 RepID=UPI0029DA7099|nr:class B sortase [Collinsella sp.]MCI6575633.1 class B sortase [Collinsella sp.]